MTQKETRSKMIEKMENRLSGMFEGVEINGKRCFLTAQGSVFHVCGLGGTYNSLVIEYADNLEDAKMNRMEDGDLFPMDEYDEDEMFQAMIKEIRA